MSATHGQLVEVASRWLRNTRGCSVVLAELTTSVSEIPDAIGWRVGSHSILVECKTSRGDFHRDAAKPHRNGVTAGVGQERYYLAPTGILKAADMPSGWGLVEWDGKRVRYVVKLENVLLDDARGAADVPVLVSALRRYQGRGVSPAILEIQQLGRGDLAIVRRALERRERMLSGLPEEIEVES